MFNCLTLWQQNQMVTCNSAAAGGPGHPKKHHGTGLKGTCLRKARGEKSNRPGRQSGRQPVPGAPVISKVCLFHLLLFPLTFKAKNTQRVGRNQALRQEHDGAAVFCLCQVFCMLSDQPGEGEERILKHSNGL